MSGIIIPVLIKFVIINMVQMVRLHLDAASLTTIASVICLPVFMKMMAQDAIVCERFSVLPGNGFWKTAIGIVFLALAANLGITMIMSPLTEIMHLSNEAQETLFESNLLIQILGVGIIVPVEEEVLFRGLVYQRLKDYNIGWISVILAALLFSIYHGNAIQILFAFPMALLMIGVYEKSRTLAAPILFHIVVNISSIVIAVKCG